MGEKAKKEDFTVYFIKIPYLCSVIRMNHQRWPSMDTSQSGLYGLFTRRSSWATSVR